MKAALMTTTVALLLSTSAQADRHPPRYGNHDVMQSPGSHQGHAKAHPPGWFGIRVADMTPELRTFFSAPNDRGVLVTRVYDGGAAERAGLKVGDVIVAIGKRQVKNPQDLKDAVSAQRPGQGLQLDVVRGRVKWKLARRAPVPQRHRAAPVQPKPRVEIPRREDRIHRKMNALDGRLERLEQLLEQALKKPQEQQLAPPVMETEVRPRSTPPPRLEQIRPVPQVEEPEMVPAPERDSDFNTQPVEPLPRHRI